MVESIRKYEYYYIYRIRIDNKVNSLSRLFKVRESENAIYMEIKVKISQADLVKELNEFAEKTNPSIEIPETPKKDESFGGFEEEIDPDFGVDSEEKPEQQENPEETEPTPDVDGEQEDNDSNETNKNESVQTYDKGIIGSINMALLALGGLLKSRRKRD